MSAPSLAIQINGGAPVSADQLNTYAQTCNTASDLRSFTGVSGVQVYMRGTSAVGDGGQGFFYWNASGVASDDNGVTTIVPLGSTLGTWTRIQSGAVAMMTSQKLALQAVAGELVFDVSIGKLCVYTGSTWQTVTSV